MKTKTKIAIVLGIALVIAGIWGVKNLDFSAQEVAAQTEAERAGTTTEKEAAATDVQQTDETESAQTESDVTEETATEAAGSEAAPAVPLQAETFDFDELVSHGKPMILDFGADECGPCQVMAPDLAAFHEEFGEDAVIRYYDVWEKPELASGYPIQVVPTQLFFMPDGSPYAPSDAMDDSGVMFTMYIDRETDEHGLTTHSGILTKDQLETILKDMEAQVQ